MNATTRWGLSPLHEAYSLDIFTASVDRGADLTLRTKYGVIPLMSHMPNGPVGIVARLLQDPRVRATIDAQNDHGHTVLHYACSESHDIWARSMARLLLQAGANPLVTDNEGLPLLAFLQKRYPSHQTTIALLHQAIAEADRTSLLIKARRLVTLATSTRATPSYLQGHVVQDQPLPCLVLTSMLDGNLAYLLLQAGASPVAIPHVGL